LLLREIALVLHPRAGGIWKEIDSKSEIGVRGAWLQ
jgi:hypothetical protein